MNRETRVKSFDCVKWTRETRDRINAEIKDMSHEELSTWFESRRPTDPFLAELYDRRTPPTRVRGRTDTAGDLGPSARISTGHSKRTGE